jgi:YfiH family protein
VFAGRVERRVASGVVDVVFTDRHGGVSPPPYDSLDLGDHRSADDLAANLTRVAAALDVTSVALMKQVHGSDVRVVHSDDATWSTSTGMGASAPTCDALVTRLSGVALCVRVADCVPVVLADPGAGIVAVAHAGREGVVRGVVTATLQTMADLGADRVEAWIGPHVCGGCYEVPAAMRAEVAAVEPLASATTTWGTASLDLGAAVAAQLSRAGCQVHDVGPCTRESGDLFSYRRDGDRAGRSAGLVVLRSRSDG